ncbi:MAG TPA: nucleotidyltransferase domain-containing protein [Pseudobdellovibrionaceae bacterium]|jgi:predicted nucleotidyltransferase
MHVELEKDKNFAEIVSKLKAHFKPEKIFLFGSRAKGTSTPDSDYDLLLVVKNSDKTLRERMREARQVLRGRTVAVDIFIYTSVEFDELKEEFSSIAYTAFTEGLEL